MSELLELVRQALGVTVLMTAPVAVAAVLGAVAAALLGLWTGLTDPVVGLVTRAFTVAVAVVVLFVAAADEVETLARSTFHAIAQAGRNGSG